MKQILSSLALILLSFGISEAQHLANSYTNIVFVDGANVREAPSLSSKVIGNVYHNTELLVCQTGLSEDSIGGIANYWQRITYQNKNGYIWRPILAQGHFKSQLNLDDIFLIHLASNGNLEFKVFNKNQLKSHSVIPVKKHQYLSGSFSFGTTYNSSGNEVIAVIYDDNGSYDLFEWDGTRIFASDLKLRDESVLTNQFLPFNDGIINADQVNIRMAPDSSSAVLATVSAFTFVPLVKIDSVQAKLQGIGGFWHCIRWQGKEAFVWSDFIDIPIRYIQSNKHKEQSFLYTDKALYAFEGKTILDRHPISMYDYERENRLVDLGNMGYRANTQILALCYFAHGCGEDGGDFFYLWDGSKIKFFGHDYGIGDGGLSEIHSLLFPGQLGGIKGQIIQKDMESEAFGNYGSQDCSESGGGITYESTTILSYDGEKLVEVPSVHTKIRELIAANFPQYRLMHYTIYDLNDDGLDDVAFFLNYTITDENSLQLKPVVGMAYGDVKGNFGSLKYNRELVKFGVFSVEFKPSKSDLEIQVKYNIGYFAGSQTNPNFSNFVFQYDTTQQAYYWYSKTESKNISEESKFSVQWEKPSTSYFKTNKIRFENAWESKTPNNSDY